MSEKIKIEANGNYLKVEEFDEELLLITESRDPFSDKATGVFLNKQQVQELIDALTDFLQSLE